MIAALRSCPEPDEVHVWRAPLDVDPADLAHLSASLARAEREHADSFRFDRDRSRNGAARGWLRHLLGGYLGVEPAALRFVLDSGGKPRLAQREGDWLRFSVTHSEGLALYAIANGREVGVDVERILGSFPVDAVAVRFFSREEQAQLRALPRTLQVRAFYECWTRKEAYLKGIGLGLTGLERSATDDSEWSVHAIDAGSQYAAAVAVAGSARVSATPSTLSLEPALAALR